jgi:prophage regulatory protein
MRVIPYSRLPDKGIYFSGVWLRQLIAEGKFPKPIRLSANRVAFVESEIDEWLRARAAERDDAA